jgi:hypothetical protein
MKHNAPYATIEKGRVHVGSQVLIDHTRYVVTAVSSDGLVLQPVKASLVGLVCCDKSDLPFNGISLSRFVIPERLSADGRYMVRDVTFSFASGEFSFGRYLRIIDNCDLVVVKKRSIANKVITAYNNFINN